MCSHILLGDLYRSSRRFLSQSMSPEPSAQKLWKTEFFDELWKYQDGSKYFDLRFAEQCQQMAKDGYLDLPMMETFCRENVEELLTRRG